MFLLCLLGIIIPLKTTPIKNSSNIIMKVEIWSDVVCPFCYIGKRRFEKALEGFEAKDKVEVEWRSFQLDPDLEYVPGESEHDYLGKSKGTLAADGTRINDTMTAM